MKMFSKPAKLFARHELVNRVIFCFLHLSRKRTWEELALYHNSYTLPHVLQVTLDLRSGRLPAPISPPFRLEPPMTLYSDRSGPQF